LKNHFAGFLSLLLVSSCTIPAPVIDASSESSGSHLTIFGELEEAEKIAVFDALILDGIVASIDALTDEHNRPKFHFGLFGSPNPAKRPRFDPKYFRADIWTFKLQTNVTASQALDAFFATPEVYAMECATAISVLHYAAVRFAFFKATGSDALFDERFADMTIGRLGQGTENDIAAARKLVTTGGMRLGDHAYFHNPSAHPKAVAGGWNGENVIILGKDLYFGHPFGITSSDKIIQKLNSVHDPAIKKPQSAYLGGPIYRLDGASLWPAVKAYLEDNANDSTTNDDSSTIDNSTENDESSTIDNSTENDESSPIDDSADNDDSSPIDDSTENDDTADLCTDVPPDPNYSCDQQAKWGKCDEPWMDNYCNHTCGRCDSPAPVCEDVLPPGSVYTCEQQASWGKCDEPWMDGYCNLTCERCSNPLSDTAAAPVCTNIAPNADYTCKQQASWGKCNEVWLWDYCNASCGRCVSQ